jgi:uncharacterized Zn finger protein
MEALADLSGDLSEQIAVRERDLSSGYRFLEIAELCRGRGNDELSLDWASRGIAAFPDPPDPRLRAFLITEYRRRGLTAQALEQSLAAFTERATLESYRELATDARAANQWAEQRERALELLRGATLPPRGTQPVRAAAPEVCGWRSRRRAGQNTPRTRSSSTASTLRT